MILAIDIGGTKTKFGLFTSDHFFDPPLWSETISTLYDYESFLNKIKEVSQRVETKLYGVGISFGVAFSEDGRVITAAGKMPNFVGRHLIDDLETIFGCKCKVAHDCICALMAETEVGKIIGSVAYVTVSSGTGGAVLLHNGRERILFRTRLAHQIIAWKGPICHCGQRGCLATFTDGIEIQKRQNMEIEKITDEKFWKEFTEALSIGIVNLSWMYPIEAIIVGGGIALNNSFVNSNLPSLFYNTRSTGNQKLCELLYAKLGVNSSLIGACFLGTDRGITVKY